MKSQILHTVWCHISCEAAGEFWHWSLSGVKGLRACIALISLGFFSKPATGASSWWGERVFFVFLQSFQASCCFSYYRPDKRFNVFTSILTATKETSSSNPYPPHPTTPTPHRTHTPPSLSPTLPSWAQCCIVWEVVTIIWWDFEFPITLLGPGLKHSSQIQDSTFPQVSQYVLLKGH